MNSPSGMTSQPAGDRFSAREAAVSLQAQLALGDIDFAFRMLARAVTNFRRMGPEQCQKALEKPHTTGSTEWDTLLAVVIGRECDRAGIQRPNWTYPPPLRTEWVATSISVPSERWIAKTKSRTPKEFSNLGIWFDPGNLESA